MNFIDGWWQEAKPIPTENEGEPITNLEYLVIHCISLPEGQFGNGYIRQLFTNQLDTKQHKSFQSLDGVKVSAHFVIDREGSVEQFVSILQQAWHAGASSLGSRTGFNQRAISVEMEGSVSQEFTPIQYDTLNQLILALREVYPQLTAGRIVGHADIAPLRKQDPGPYFYWGNLV